MKQRKKKLDILVEIGKINPQNYFEPNLQAIAQRNKKRQYYINSYSNDHFSHADSNQDFNLTPLKKNPRLLETKKKGSIIYDLSKINGSQIDSRRQTKQILLSPLISKENGNPNNLKENSQDNNMRLKKMHSKSFKNEIKSILDYFSEIVKTEAKLSESMSSIGYPKNFLGTESVIFSAQINYNQKFIDIKSLNIEEKEMIVSFLFNKNVQKIIMPDWAYFRNGIHFISGAHKQSAEFIKKGVSSLISVFSNEYIKELADFKQQKKKVKSGLEKNKAECGKIEKTFKKVSEEYNNLVITYEELKNKKESPMILIKKEMEVRISRSNLDDLKVKLDDAYEEYYEKANLISSFNQIMDEFRMKWNNLKHTAFATTLRTIVDAYDESISQSYDTFIEILNFHHPLPNKRMSRKKSIMCDPYPILLENLNSSQRQKKTIFGSDGLTNCLEEATVNDSEKEKESVPQRETLKKDLAESASLTPQNSCKVKPGTVRFEFNPNENSNNFVSEKNKRSNSLAFEFFEEENEKGNMEQKIKESGKIESNNEEIKTMTMEVLSVIMKRYVTEIYKYYDDLKIKLASMVKYFRSIKEDFAVQIKNTMTDYHKDFHDLLELKFMKGFGDKNGRYIQIFAIIIRRFKIYDENLINYIKDIGHLLMDIKEKYKLAEKLKNENLEVCLELIKAYEINIKSIQNEITVKYNNSKKSGINQCTDLNISLKFLKIKKEFFMILEENLDHIHKVFNDNAQEIVNIKFKFLSISLKFIEQQRKNIKSLVAELDRKYAKILSLEEDFDQDKKDDAKEAERAMEESFQKDESYLGEQELKEMQSVEDDISNLNREDISIPSFNEKVYDTTAFFNQLFKTFFDEWTSNDSFIMKIMKKLNTSFNKKRNPLFDEIFVKSVKIDKRSPHFKEIIPQKSQAFEFLYDFDLSYRGEIEIEIETSLNLEWAKSKVPVFATVLIKSFTGKARICFVPLRKGKSWYSFIGEPKCNIKIDPKIGKSKFAINNIPGITDMIIDLVLKKIQAMTYPNRKQLKIPMIKILHNNSLNQNL